MAFKHRAPQPPAWAELKRIAVDPHPFAEELGAPRHVPVDTVPGRPVAAAWGSRSRVFRLTGRRRGVPMTPTLPKSGVKSM
jgi:hypothetical protein